MIDANIALAYILVYFFMYVGFLAVVFYRSERFLNKVLAYIKAPTASEAEAAVRISSPPPEPELTGEQKFRALQDKEYALANG